MSQFVVKIKLQSQAAISLSMVIVIQGRRQVRKLENQVKKLSGATAYFP